MLRPLLGAVLVLSIIAVAHSQLDDPNKEGPNLLELVNAGPGPAAFGLSGPAPTSYRVIAVESIRDSVKAVRLNQPRSDGGGVTSLDSSSTSSSTDTIRHKTRAAKRARKGTKVGVAVRPAESPAANAPLASATPLFGSPAAGTVIPGRFVVFFHKNVTSVNAGLNRCGCEAFGCHVWGKELNWSTELASA